MDTKVLQSREAHLTFRKCVFANKALESESSKCVSCSVVSNSL